MAALVLMLLARELVVLLLAELVLMLLARELLAALLLAALLLAREPRVLVLMLLARALLVLAELLLAPAPREFLVSRWLLEVFAKCFESAVALGLSERRPLCPSPACCRGLQNCARCRRILDTSPQTPAQSCHRPFPWAHSESTKVNSRAQQIPWLALASTQSPTLCNHSWRSCRRHIEFHPWE